MKILQINNFHRLVGGADRVYLETSDLLESKGHDIQFFSTKNKDNKSTPYEEYFVDDIDYFSLKKFHHKIGAAFRYIYSQKAARKLNKLIKEKKPDIAHIHVFQGRLSCSILPVLKRHRIPIIFSLHEYKVLCPVYTFLDGKKEICEACKGKYFYNCLIKKCNHNSASYSFISMVESYLRNTLFPIERYGNHYIMVSDFIYNKHIEHRPAFASKSSRLYNFNDFKLKPQKSIKGNYFLFFGRLSSEKGVLTMLEAFIQKPLLKLKIAGTGAMEFEIKNFIKTNGMENVELLGYKKGNELNDIISNASFTVVPSEWYESFGLIITESMALGTPVIGSAIGAIPELIKENENGFLFQSRNVMDLVKQLEHAQTLDEDSYRILSENAQRFALNNFRKEDYYKQLISIYDNSIKSYNEKA